MNTRPTEARALALLASRIACRFAAMLVRAVTDELMVSARRGEVLEAHIKILEIFLYVGSLVSHLNPSAGGEVSGSRKGIRRCSMTLSRCSQCSAMRRTNICPSHHCSPIFLTLMLAIFFFVRSPMFQTRQDVSEKFAVHVEVARDELIDNEQDRVYLGEVKLARQGTEVEVDVGHERGSRGP